MSLVERLIEDFAKQNGFVYNLHALRYVELRKISYTQRRAIDVYEKDADTFTVYVKTFDLLYDIIDEDEYITTDDETLFEFNVAKNDQEAVEKLREKLTEFYLNLTT